MNDTYFCLAGQGIAIGNNFCMISDISFANDNVSVNNDRNKVEITEASHLTSLTKATVGTQTSVNTPITFYREGNA